MSYPTCRRCGSTVSDVNNELCYSCEFEPEPSQPTQDPTNTEWVDQVLEGYENDRRWDSLGEVVNEGVKFLDFEEAKATILKHVKEAEITARIDELERQQGTAWATDQLYRGKGVISPKSIIEVNNQRIITLKSQLTPTQEDAE